MHLDDIRVDVMYYLWFLEIDRLSKRVSFVVDSSSLMEQILNIPQQWEARMEPNIDSPIPLPDPYEEDEGDRRGIYFEHSMLMKPNDNSLIPVPDPSEVGLPNADAPIPVSDTSEAGC
ncbi:hypothetical protein HAX54_049949 [Datura stramonium]|uniref:Uncharacterized protein n=1 Tax=Datura stramonium TaxID=4076 RepID=A0ABS8WN97_DATST|nr:hypothetical protein [Datura stramonium]